MKQQVSGGLLHSSPSSFRRNYERERRHKYRKAYNTSSGSRAAAARAGAVARRPQWAIWRWTPTPGGGWQKPPFMATQPERHASLTDSSTWTDYGTALAAVRAGHGDGVTYVLTKQDEFAAIDLDHCRDIVTGSVEPWAQLMLEQALHSYAEITPSGNGLRIWGTAAGNPLHRKFAARYRRRSRSRAVSRY